MPRPRLHQAVYDGDDVMACEELLKAGADVDAVDAFGSTTLFLAAQKGREACVSLLLKAGADANAANEYG